MATKPRETVDKWRKEAFALRNEVASVKAERDDWKTAYEDSAQARREALAARATAYEGRHEALVALGEANIEIQALRRHRAWLGVACLCLVVVIVIVCAVICWNGVALV